MFIGGFIYFCDGVKVLEIAVYLKLDRKLFLIFKRLEEKVRYRDKRKFLGG